MQVCDMHARLKKLESDRDMEWGHMKETQGRTASFGNGTQEQPPLHATHSSPAINGGHENLNVAKTQVGLVSQKLPVTGASTGPALHARQMGLGRLSHVVTVCWKIMSRCMQCTSYLREVVVMRT